MSDSGQDAPARVPDLGRAPPANQMHCDPSFRALLERSFSLESLNAHPGSVFGVTREGKLAYLNPGWERFAEENDGQPTIRERWGLGADYFAAIPEPLQAFYRELFDSAQLPGGSLRPRSHNYECSSPGVFRLFQMQVHALHERAGAVVINSLVSEVPHDEASHPSRAPRLEAYQDSEGNLHQCCHCRRVRHRSEALRWDWVPAWVEHPPVSTSHTICAVCLDYYYPSVR